jgi:hypothetical protein
MHDHLCEKLGINVLLYSSIVQYEHQRIKTSAFIIQVYRIILS